MSGMEDTGAEGTGMADEEARASGDPIAERLYDADAAYSAREIIDASGLSGREFAEVNDLMRALVELRETEQAITEASEKYMKLSAQDMRALHYLIVAKAQGDVVTPGMIAAHLKISPASTTKLLNRLERGEHITRSVHPTDRRAFAIEVTPETEASAKETVGKQHAKRLRAAARLSSKERQTVTRFLRDMAQEISLANADWTPS